MNQLCKVCGEPAAGYHFGAFTCEGCKSFFGRTYNNLAALGECKNNGQCVINKKNRTSCKSCRLKKCLMVGMSKSGSRYGRRSNWFKIHCLIQDQAEMNNRLAEQGVIGSNGQLTPAFNENKDLVSQYKDNNNSSSTPHNTSSNGASPSSSDASGGGAIPSPYSSLFEAAKANGFAPRGSPSPPERRGTTATNGHAGGIGAGHNGHNGHSRHGFPFHAAMPLSPVSPLSPLNPASRFFFHPSAALFGKGFNGLPKLLNGELAANYADVANCTEAAYQSRFLPMHTIDPVLKASVKLCPEVPEQEKPIDLSVKKGTEEPSSADPIDYRLPDRERL